MLAPRIAPVLLVDDGALVKTTRFQDPKYVGDPLNAVRIFNEKEADELVVLDISATERKREPDYEMIRTLAMECRMPLCYGGGVTETEQVRRIVSLGVEKVAISAAAIANPGLIGRAAADVGSQSVAVILDIRKTGFLRGRHEIWTHRGQVKTGLRPVDFARQMEAQGAGEIIVNHIDRDGTMSGYDLEALAPIRAATTLPMSFVGGAGSLEDMQELISRFGISGVAAGSLFVFKGKYRAVLINYPARAEKNVLIEKGMAAYMEQVKRGL